MSTTVQIAPLGPKGSLVNSRIRWPLCLGVRVNGFLVMSAFQDPGLSSTFRRIVRMVLTRVLTLLRSFVVGGGTFGGRFLRGEYHPCSRLDNLVAVCAVTCNGSYVGIM